MILFAIETAARKGEILKLRWEHVDLSKKIATLYDTKNGEDRSIPLSPAAVELLKNLPKSIDGRVFGTSDNAAKHAFYRICKIKNINDLRFHDLRHEALSRMSKMGFDALHLTAISGHKTLEMVKRYTHLKAEDLAEELALRANS